MADISVDLFTWSSTAGSNSPAGATTIGTGLDDNLRAMQAAIKAALESLSSVAGTNTITATCTGLTAYANGQVFRFIPANTNTGATTLNVTSLGAKNVFWNGAACVGGELRANIPATVIYDGTQFHVIANGFNAPFLDTHPVVQGSADSTKKARLEADGITTATTRVLTVPDADIMLAGHATGLTANRIPYASGTTGGLLTDSANFTFDGTTFALGGTKFTVAQASGNTVVGGTLGVTGATTLSAALTLSYANPDITAITITASTGTNASGIKFNNTGGNLYIGRDNNTGSRATGTAYATYWWNETNQPLIIGVNNAFCAGFSSALTGGATTLSVDANGYIIRTPSDDRFKAEQVEITDGIDIVRALPAISFEFSGDMKAEMGEGRHIGWAAQSVQKAASQYMLVSAGTDGKLSLNDPKMAAILWSAVRSIDSRLAQVEAR